MEFLFYPMLFGILLLFGCFLFFALRQKNKLLGKVNALQEMLAALSYKQHKENERLTKQFHDGLKNDIIAAKNFLLLSEQAGNAEQRFSFLKDAMSCLDAAFENAKLTSNQIMPSSIKAGNIVEALQNYFSGLQSETGTKFDITLETGELELLPLQAYEVYCIIVELCGNIIKHNTATEVRLNLLHKNNELALELNDNGLPYDLKECSDQPQSKGLKTIFARLSALEGTLTQTKQSHGNHIIIKTPIK